MESQSPYAPPASDVAINEIRFGSPWKGVVLGVLTDMGGTLLFGALLGVAYGIFMASHGVAPQEITRTMTEQNSALVMGFSYAFGALFSLLGGYVCARIVRRNEMRWALVTGVISAGLGSLLFGSDDGPGMEVLGDALTLGAVAIGGWLARRRNRRELAGFSRA